MKKHETPSFEYLLNKAAAYFWLGLGLVCVGAAVFCGAWWHLFTAAICAVMYLGFKSEADEQEEA